MRHFHGFDFEMIPGLGAGSLFVKFRLDGAVSESTDVHGLLRIRCARQHESGLARGGENGKDGSRDEREIVIRYSNTFEQVLAKQKAA